MPGSSSQVSVHSSVSQQQQQQEDHAYNGWGHQEDPQSEFLHCLHTYHSPPVLHKPPWLFVTCQAMHSHPQVLQPSPLPKAPPL